MVGWDAPLKIFSGMGRVQADSLLQSLHKPSKIPTTTIYHVQSYIYTNYLKPI